MIKDQDIVNISNLLRDIAKQAPTKVGKIIAKAQKAANKGNSSITINISNEDFDYLQSQKKLNYAIYLKNLAARLDNKDIARSYSRAKDSYDSLSDRIKRKTPTIEALEEYGFSIDLGSLFRGLFFTTVKIYW